VIPFDKYGIWHEVSDININTQIYSSNCENFHDERLFCLMHILLDDTKIYCFRRIIVRVINLRLFMSCIYFHQSINAAC